MVVTTAFGSVRESCRPIPPRWQHREGEPISHGRRARREDMTATPLLIVAASVCLIMLRPRGIAEVYWGGIGALALVFGGYLPLRAALGAVEKGTDVYLFLIGMMLIAGVAREEGVFDWLASVAVAHGRGSVRRLFALVYVVAVVVTALLSNDATAVVLTPAILVAVKRARVDALPHLFVCALVANAASFVLPISNPANLVLFRGAPPALGAWLAAFFLPSVASIGVTYAVMRWMFRCELAVTYPVETDGHPLSRRGLFVLIGIGATVIVLLCASAVHIDLGFPTFLCAVVVATAIVVLGRRSVLPLLREVSWSTLLLVAALFVLVEQVERSGGLELAASVLARATSSSDAVIVGTVVAVANNVVNNLPLGLLAGAAIERAAPASTLRDAILIGVDLGPNLAVTGSLATILWLQALRRENVRVGFWQFSRVGAVAMFFALAAALASSLAVHRLGLTR